MRPRVRRRSFTPPATAPDPAATIAEAPMSTVLSDCDAHDAPSADSPPRPAVTATGPSIAAPTASAAARSEPACTSKVHVVSEVPVTGEPADVRCHDLISGTDQAVLPPDCRAGQRGANLARTPAGRAAPPAGSRSPRPTRPHGGRRSPVHASPTCRHRRLSATRTAGKRCRQSSDRSRAASGLTRTQIRHAQQRSPTTTAHSSAAAPCGK